MSQEHPSEKPRRYTRDSPTKGSVSGIVAPRQKRNARSRSAGLSTGGLSPNEQMAIKEEKQGGIMSRMAQNRQEREERANKQSQVLFLAILSHIF